MDKVAFPQRRGTAQTIKIAEKLPQYTRSEDSSLQRNLLMINTSSFLPRTRIQRPELELYPSFARYSLVSSLTGIVNRSFSESMTERFTEAFGRDVFTFADRRSKWFLPRMGI
ncbi:hypothetical protein ABKN59_009583 [Abortiporus biennis]